MRLHYCTAAKKLCIEMRKEITFVVRRLQVYLFIKYTFIVNLAITFGPFGQGNDFIIAHKLGALYNIKIE